MKIYRLWPSVRYQNLILLSESGKTILQQVVSTKSLKSVWKQERVELMACADERMIPRPIGDCVSFPPTTLALSRRACEAVAELRQKDIEFLPLKLVPPHDDWEFFVPHVTLELDALDITRSEVDSNEGRVIGIDRHVFIPEIIGDRHFFRMKHNPRHAIYVTEKFVRHIDASYLLGFRFPVLWSDVEEPGA